MSLNRIMVIGHVGQDPEIRYTPTGMPVVSFSVATDEAYVDKEGKREERTEWHRAVVVGKLALTCHAYLKKGQQVFVEGPLAHARMGEQRKERPANRNYRTPRAVPWHTVGRTGRKRAGRESRGGEGIRKW